MTDLSTTKVKKTRSTIKREAIIDGALAAFQQYGVADSSMDKIAELARVSKRTVYNHFESKEILVLQIISAEWEKHTIVSDVVYDSHIPIKIQLQTLVANELELLSNIDMMELIRVAMAHFLFAPELLNSQVAKLFEQETALKRWLKLALADGKLKKLDVKFAEEQLIGLLKARAFWPQMMRQEDALSEQEKQELVVTTVGMFLSYYQV